VSRRKPLALIANSLTTIVTDRNRICLQLAQKNVKQSPLLRIEKSFGFLRRRIRALKQIKRWAGVTNGQADGLSLPREIVSQANVGPAGACWRRSNRSHDPANRTEPSRRGLADVRPGAQARPGSGAETPETKFAEEIITQIPFLRRAVRRWHQDRADADDLVQDTLVRALANAHLWQPGSNLRAWLFTIMRRQFLAEIARSNRAVTLWGLAAADGAAVVADAREARLVLRDIGSVLHRLPQKQRTALQLAGIEGKSYEEVAAAMGLSVGAVRCQLARARYRLRAAVDGDDDRSPCASDPTRHRLPAATRSVFSHAAPAWTMAVAD
jgi:RNA polymerase sigma-70 factor, ECF subfamily